MNVMRQPSSKIRYVPRRCPDYAICSDCEPDIALLVNLSVILDPEKVSADGVCWSVGVRYDCCSVLTESPGIQLLQKKFRTIAYPPFNQTSDVTVSNGLDGSIQGFTRDVAVSVQSARQRCIDNNHNDKSSCDKWITSHSIFTIRRRFLMIIYWAEVSVSKVLEWP